MDAPERILQYLATGTLEERRAAAKAVSSNPQAIYLEGLLTALEHDADEWVRIDAAFALGEIGDRRAVPALIGALHSNDVMARWQIEWDSHLALPAGPERQKRFVFLWETLVAEISDIRVTAAQALGKLGDIGAVGDLEIASRDPHDQAIRQAATEAIARIKGVGGSSRDEIAEG